MIDHPFRSCRWLSLVISAAAIALSVLCPPELQAANTPETDTFTTLDGEERVGDVREIRGGWVVYGLDGKRVDFLQLREIRRAVRPDKPTGITSWVYLVGGGRIKARSVTIAEGEARVGTMYGSLSLPLGMVAGLLFEMPADNGTPRESFDEAIADREAREDRLLAIREDRLLGIGGLLVSLERGKITFEIDGEQRSVEQNRVYGLAIANPGEAPDHNGAGLFELADGSTLWARPERLERGTLHVTLLDGQTQLQLPWRSVRRIRVRSDRMVYLSDLTPVSVSEDPLLDYARPWRRDKNVRGGPLVLDARHYEKGIGVRSRSELVFAPDGKFATFAATIGIDANTRPQGKGDCAFVVLVDGEEKLRQRMRGTDKPRQIVVDIRDAQRVTLLVEYGEDLSFADHANWCEARFVKAPPSRSE